MPKIVQFEGKFYHENCFTDYLNEEKSKNRVASNYVPNVQRVDSVSDDELCEECSGKFDDESETPVIDVEVDDDDDDDKKDNVVDTPSPAPRRRR